MRTPGASPTPPDAELITRAQAGETGAFEVLVRRYRDGLVSVAQSRLGCREAAEDAAQETLLAAYRYRASYRPIASFRTWLWTILLNQCNRRAKRVGRRVDAVAQASDSAANEKWTGAFSRESGPLESLLARERRQLLEQLLDRLTPAQADALRLRFFAGLKFREIAETMDCSLGTAKNRVRWGLLRLTSLVDSSTSGALPETKSGRVPGTPRGESR